MGRRLYRISKELKNLEEVKDIFILDCDPMYGTSLASPGPNPVSSKSSEEIIIEGRILPKLEPYCQRSFRIRITLLPDYPFEPPKLRILDRTYHPNIDINGKLCIPLANGHDCYNPAVSLADIIQNAEQLISSFDEELVINFDAYEKYRSDRDEFNRKTLDFILCYGHPRT
jgi:ubiquitin-protein ligase